MAKLTYSIHEAEELNSFRIVLVNGKKTIAVHIPKDEFYLTELPRLLLRSAEVETVEELEAVLRWLLKDD